jgi:hypothetical protein
VVTELAAAGAPGCGGTTRKSIPFEQEAGAGGAPLESPPDRCRYAETAACSACVAGRIKAGRGSCCNSFDTALATSTAPRIHIYTIDTMTPSTPILGAIEYRVKGIVHALNDRALSTAERGSSARSELRPRLTSRKLVATCAGVQL